MKHALIAAGGTGGHVFPALAVAKELHSRGWKISWIGTKDRLESRLVPEAGFDFYTLDQQGIRGKGLFGYLAAPFRVCNSISKARQLLKQLDVEIVVGFGGYTAGPAGVAAKINGTPLVIHEQNAIPGLTNRLLAHFASKTLLGFALAAEKLKKGQVTGNPVREEISELATRDRKVAQVPLQLLVIGGSLGARYLNETVPAALATWNGPDLQVRHQCGAGNQEIVSAGYRQSNTKAEVSEFIDDMAVAYENADLVICRAGALTVAELACAGVPAVLVPFPFAVDDHQTENAKVLVEAGSGTIAQQAEFDASALRNLLEELVQDAENLRARGLSGRAVAQPQAAQTIADICEHQAMEKKAV